MTFRDYSRSVPLEMLHTCLLCHLTMASIMILTHLRVYPCLIKVQMLQAAVSGLQPNHPYVLALSRNADGSGPLVPPLQQFKTWAAGAALVNSIGPIRPILQENVPPRYLVIVPGTAHQHGLPVQTQLSNEVVRP